MTDGRGHDVAILGGGLAGLTLALHLRNVRPDTTIVVAEKRPGPAPDAAFKVGESSVEIGAYYYREDAGMKDHLERDQLRKNGLGFFYPAKGNADITARVEFPGLRNPRIWTHQIDRGRFENELGDRCRAAGIDLLSGAFVDGIELARDGGDHSVTVVRGGPGGERSTLRSRWLVDAAGRSFLLKRKLGLEKGTDHAVNAAWIRLANGLDLEDWGAGNEEWLNRMPSRGLRMFSTNHLMGEGYWVWLIPLATGPISIGVCADPAFHPYERFSDLDRLLDWLNEHEPQLGETLERRRDDVLDFLKIEHFSHGCERVFSRDRWCITGEAGVFLDPLYSPGSDYIAMSNTFIADLIVRDLAGEAISSTSAWRRLRARAFFAISARAASRPSGGAKARKPPFDVGKMTRKMARDDRVEFYNFLFLRLFEGNLAAYLGQYRLFGNAQVMLAKGLFGVLVYWGTIANLALHRKLTDPDFFSSVFDQVIRSAELGQRMEALFREWHDADRREWSGVTIRPENFRFLVDRQEDLVTDLDDETMRKRVASNVDHLYALAVILFHKAAENLPERPGDDVAINPLGISLDPARWSKDGLFTSPGITFAQAREMLPGVVEEFFLDRRGATVTEPAAVEARV